MNPDIIGSALKAYHYTCDTTPLIVHNNYGEPEKMEIKSLYRTRELIPDYEIVMTDLAVGKTLEIGSGCGSHILLLQDKAIEVVGVDISSGSCEVARARGARNIIQGTILDLEEKEFDTVTMVMNGIGVVGTIQGLKESLNVFGKLLNIDGQILFDTTDISYLGRKSSGNSYFGEVRFQFEYKEEKGQWFDWLYIDINTLEQICRSAGWQMQIVFQEDDYHYVIRLQNFSDYN